MRRREQSDSGGGVRQALAARWRERLARAESIRSGPLPPDSTLVDVRDGRRQFYEARIETVEGQCPVELHAWQLPTEWRPSWASGCDRVLVTGSTVAAVEMSSYSRN